MKPSGQRITPLQARKAGEVRICTVEQATVFDSQSSQMSIGDQVCRRLSLLYQLTKNDPVSLGRGDNPCAGLIEPALYSVYSLFHCERIRKNPPVRADPDEGCKYRPAQINAIRSGELLVPPEAAASCAGPLASSAYNSMLPSTSISGSLHLRPGRVTRGCCPG
jgi:hypothetical protein